MIVFMGEEDEMKKRHHTPEQIVRKLREADRLLGERSAMVAVCKHFEVTEQTYYRWRNQYGGMKADDAKRLKELERENSRLKKIVANQALDIDMLKEVNWETSKPGQTPGCDFAPHQNL
jgi:transposase-like protein